MKPTIATKVSLVTFTLITGCKWASPQLYTIDLFCRHSTCGTCTATWKLGLDQMSKEHNKCKKMKVKDKNMMKLTFSCKYWVYSLDL